MNKSIKITSKQNKKKIINLIKGKKTRKHTNQTQLTLGK